MATGFVTPDLGHAEIEGSEPSPGTSQRATHSVEWQLQSVPVEGGEPCKTDLTRMLEKGIDDKLPDRCANHSRNEESNHDQDFDHTQYSHT